MDTLLDHHPQKTEETPKEIEEKKPGWLALHWYWIGVPLSLWGAARLIPMSFAVWFLLTMSQASSGILLYLPYLILFLTALAGGVLGGALQMSASQALYDQIETDRQNLNMYQGDALWEHLDQIPEGYLNGDGYLQTVALRNQGLLILVLGVVLGAVLFFWGAGSFAAAGKKTRKNPLQNSAS